MLSVDQILSKTEPCRRGRTVKGWWKESNQDDRPDRHQAQMLRELAKVVI